MGIRFKCHHCQAPLNIKSDLATKRGLCPHCHGKFRIPAQDQELSLSIDQAAWNSSTITNGQAAEWIASDSDVSAASISEAATPTIRSKTPKNEPSTIEQLYLVRPPSGGEYGPAAIETIEIWIAQRRLTAETMVCPIGTSQWKKARDVFASLFAFDR